MPIHEPLLVLSSGQTKKGDMSPVVRIMLLSVSFLPFLLAGQALCSGWVARRGGLPYRRTSQPREYWTYVILLACMGASFLFLGFAA